MEMWIIMWIKLYQMSAGAVSKVILSNIIAVKNYLQTRWFIHMRWDKSRNNELVTIGTR